MVHVHERVPLIILATDVPWHLNCKAGLVEVVAASVERGRVESIARGVGVTINRGGVVCSS